MRLAWPYRTSLAMPLLVAACAVPGPAEVWSLRDVAGGSELHVDRPEGAPLLSVACLAGPELVVTAPRLDPVASNEEFAFGAGAEVVLLVAEVGRGSAPGVTARGAPPPGLFDAIVAEGGFSALYGTARVGPLTPPAAALGPFVARCRALQ